MHYDLEGKIFKSISNTDNGEVNDETLFYYHQNGSHVWASYEGGKITQGNLVAIKDKDGSLKMHYHHINNNNELMAGYCESTPSLTPEGKLTFTEHWQWLTGDKSSGTSTIVEV